jgi:hypothetical protein
VGVEVNQDGPVHLPFTQGKGIDSHTARGGSRELRRRAGEAQQGIGTDSHTLAASLTCSWLTAKHQAHLTLLGEQARGPTSIAWRKGWHRFTKGLALAGSVVAEEPSDVEMDLDGNMGQGKVSQCTLVVAMDTAGVALAAGTAGTESGGVNSDGDLICTQFNNTE